MIGRGHLFAVVVALGAAACGPQLPRIDTACGQLPLEARSSSGSLQCGPTLDFTPVNQYQGDLAAAVQDREDAVALIGGTCTGTLIGAAAGPVVLTAGHCGQVGDQFWVAFNVEKDPDGDQLVTDGTVIERADEPDYALLQLDALPQVTPTLLTVRPSDRFAIIQHPRGGPKVVAEGQYLGVCNGVVYYANLDTLVGSSGAGVLNRQGYLAGVHTDGDCATDGSGANRGWTAAAIVEASGYLQDVDIDDR
ncbi:MAG TPA: serine protease [Myxococcales bacterium]|nr:serine protease [Myxococcales bacterium]